MMITDGVHQLSLIGSIVLSLFSKHEIKKVPIGNVYVKCNYITIFVKMLKLLVTNIRNSKCYSGLNWFAVISLWKL